MTINLKHHVIKDVIDIFTSCGEIITELEKDNKKVLAKYKW